MINVYIHINHNVVHKGKEKNTSRNRDVFNIKTKNNKKFWEDLIAYFPLT
jgi:hypothetical protein